MHNQNPKPTPGADDVVEHLFRHEYGKIIAHLTRRYGTRHLELIEDAVQEALASAVQTWPFSEVPSNPSGWIFRVAKNHLIDTFRRAEKVTTNVPDEFVASHDGNNSFMKDVLLDAELRDDQLRMMFACCHPELSKESQIILTLKLVAGFGKSEIASALLKKEDAVAKSYTRAKAKLKENVTVLDVPVGKALLPRLQVVLRIIYLVFNEGYSSTSGETIIRRDLCDEAIRLAGMLLENEQCNLAVVHALMALMSFHTARFDARVGDDGEIISLEDQDRSLWDQALIGKGGSHLAQSIEEVGTSEYQIQAGMAYFHWAAPSFADTDWEKILNLYNLQMQFYPSPMAALNRLVAKSRVHGANAALKELVALENDKHLQQNHLLFAVKSDLHEQAGNRSEAKQSLEQAIELCRNLQEQRFLKKKLDKYE